MNLFLTLTPTFVVGVLVCVGVVLLLLSLLCICVCLVLGSSWDDSVGILLWYVLYIYVKLSGMYTHKYICVYFCCNTADAMRN